MELIGGDTKELGSNIVEARKPDLAGIVTDSHRNDVPVAETPSRCRNGKNNVEGTDRYSGFS
jgi:hypothetical protein